MTRARKRQRDGEDEASPTPAPEETTQHKRCKRCKATEDSLRGRGDHSSLLNHQHLCMGLDGRGQPLGYPQACPALSCEYRLNTEPREQPKPAESYKSHFSKAHSINVNSTTTLGVVRAELSADELPTTDMNGGYGLEFTRSPYSKEATRDMIQMMKDKRVEASVAKQGMQKIREWFWRWGLIPVSYHAHVSDASSPTTIASLLRRMARPGSAFTTEEAKETHGKLAVLEGSYGAEYGQLAHGSVVSSYADAAVGPKPHEVPRDPERLTPGFFDGLAGSGHFGVLVEMVSSRDGRPLDPATWGAVAQECMRTGLLLVVDEAMTAVRCGAVFMHQMPQYQRYTPSVIIFGKAFRTSGWALCAGGVSLDRIFDGSSAEQLRDAVEKQSFHSEAMTPHTVVVVADTLREITEGRLAERAAQTGKILRDILGGLAQRLDAEQERGLRPRRRRGQQDKPAIGGVGALIYIPSGLARRAGAVAVSTGEHLMRWLPYLDKGMADEGRLRELFGPHSTSIRASLLVAIGWCGVCGLSTTKGQEGDRALPPPRRGRDAGRAEDDLHARFAEDPEFTCGTCKLPICYWCRAEALEPKQDEVTRATLSHRGGTCLQLLSAAQ